MRNGCTTSRPPFGPRRTTHTPETCTSTCSPVSVRYRSPGLTAKILNSLYADLLTSGRQDGAGLSPRSVRYVHTIVGRMLGDAVRWNRLVRNPAKAADPPRASSVGGRSVTASSAETLGDFLGRSTAYGDRYYPLWVTSASTGARRGEVLGLRLAAMLI